MYDQHSRQGIWLLTVGLLVAVLLGGLFILLGGFSLVGPPILGLLGVFAAIGLGIAALWNARRYGWAWAFLLGVPGLALFGLIGFFVLFAIGVS